MSMPNGRFNITALERDPRQPLEAQLLPWLTRLVARLQAALNGLADYDLGTLTADRTVGLHLAGLTRCTLGANLTLTLTTRDVARGTTRRLEVAQDATGGRTLAFVNALTAPAIAAGATDRTLLDACFTGDGWVLSVINSGY